MGVKAFKKYFISFLLFSFFLDIFAVSVEPSSYYQNDYDFFSVVKFIESEKNKSFKLKTFREYFFESANSLKKNITQDEKPNSVEADENLEGNKDSFDATDLLLSLDGKDERGIESGDEHKEEIPEYIFNDRMGKVRRFSYDDEQTVTREYEKKDGDNVNYITEVISAYKSKIKRKIYDEKFRLNSVEIFSLTTSAKDLSLISKKTYFYDEDSVNPSKSSEEYIKENKVIETKFNEKGLVLSFYEYSFDDEKTKNKKIPVKKNVYKYDEQDRLTFEEKTIWNGEEKFVMKNTYNFTEVSTNPDFSYFENGNIRLIREYENQNDYSEKTYFDDGFSVYTYFENSVKKFEIVYFNEVEIRRRYFDD